jgi:acyl-CoA thioesterase I
MKLKNKSILAVSIVSLILVLSLVVVLSESRASNSVNGQLTRVACLGDSITNMTGYPADLQALLGKNSTVGNFGFNGAAVNFYSDRTYFFSDSYRYARNFQPTTVIIMLGTNDARSNLDGQINNFTSNYEFMLEHMINGTKPFTGQPLIFLVIPPPIFENNLNLTSTIYTQEIIPHIQQIANSTGLPLIDVYTPLVNHPEYFPDGVHPNSVGAQIIANTVYTAITSSK